MIPIDQTIIDKDNGNCWAACFASIFELPLDSVPNIHTNEWTFVVDRYLTPANLSMVRVPFGSAVPCGYSILGVPSAMFEGVYHAVVAFDGNVVHDPNPQARGRTQNEYVKGARHYWVFHPRDPSRPICLDLLRSHSWET